MALGFLILPASPLEVLMVLQSHWSNSRTLDSDNGCLLISYLLIVFITISNVVHLRYMQLKYLYQIA
jgi:hypothetical protein